jgi:mannosyl-3-phosphoglycerate phosphatase
MAMNQSTDRTPPLLVFTDLDGTLLDHATYDWSPARPALERLAAIGAVVIPATSKTRAETAPLMAALGLSGPAIVENGAGLAGLPGPAPCIARIRAALDALPAALRAQFRGFGDCTPDDVAALTGLAPDAAARAYAREFSEPGLWAGDADGLAAFEAALAPHGLTLRRGGRFLHVLPGADKAARMAEIRAGHPPCPTVALGDAPNDAEMLVAADIAIIIPNPSGPAPFAPGAAPAHARIAPAPGPAGWNAAMLDVLTALDLTP